MDNNFFKKSKKIFDILEFTAKKDSVSVREVVNGLETSRSSALRGIESLLGTGILSEYSEGSTRRFYLSNPAEFPVLDLTDNEAILTVYSGNMSISHKMRFTYDDSRLICDNLRLFFRECLKILNKRGPIMGRCCIVLPECGLSLDTNALKDLFESVFGPIPCLIMTECEYVSSLISKYDSSYMLITSSKDTAYAFLNNGRRVKLRTVQSERILRNSTVSSAAADIAVSIGNTVSLLDIKHICFDKYETFLCTRFLSKFTDTMKVFLGKDIPEGFTTNVSDTAFSHKGAVELARTELLMKLLSEAERNRQYEFLPD